MVLGINLPYDNVLSFSDISLIAGSTTGNTLLTGIHEISGTNIISGYINPNDVEVNVTLDDIRLTTNLTKEKTRRRHLILFSHNTRF